MNRRDCESNFIMSNYYVIFKVLIKWFLAITVILLKIRTHESQKSWKFEKLHSMSWVLIVCKIMVIAKSY